MDTHVRTLGTLNIFFGVASLLITICIFAVYGGPIGLYNSQADNIFALLLTVSLTFHLVLSIPCIIGGMYLRRLEEWARSVLIVTSALNILNIPIGCFLGCYGLWVLLTAETDPLFTEPPPDRRPKRPSAPGKQGRATSPEKQSTARIVPSPRS